MRNCYHNRTNRYNNNLFQDKSWIKQFILSNDATLERRRFQRTGIESFAFPKAKSTIPKGLFDGCQLLSLIIFPPDCAYQGVDI